MRRVVTLCHVGYFINSNEQKLTYELIYRIFFLLLGTKIWIFIFWEQIYQRSTHSGTKMTIYPLEENMILKNN